jgi:hypothetical protein
MTEGELHNAGGIWGEWDIAFLSFVGASVYSLNI